MKNARVLTEGAILLAVYIVLLLIYIYIPIISIISTMVLVLPFLLYSAKHPLKYSVIFFIASLLISTLIGTFFSIPVAVIYGTTGIVMGYCIQLKKSKFTIFIASSLTFLIDLIFGYIIAIKFFHYDFLKEVANMLRDSVQKSSEILKIMGQGQSDQLLAQMKNAISLMQTLFPTALVMISFFTVWLFMIVNFPILRRFQIDVPKWQPFHKIQLPKSVLWYYLITMLLSFVFHPKTGSYLGVALVNLGFIFQIILLLQGFSFVFYYGYVQKWSKGILVFIVVGTIILSPLLYIILLLGIIDLGVDLRKKIKGK